MSGRPLAEAPLAVYSGPLQVGPEWQGASHLHAAALQRHDAARGPSLERRQDRHGREGRDRARHGRGAGDAAEVPDARRQLEPSSQHRERGSTRRRLSAHGEGRWRHRDRRRVRAHADAGTREAHQRNHSDQGRVGRRRPCLLLADRAGQCRYRADLRHRGRAARAECPPPDQPDAGRVHRLAARGKRARSAISCPPRRRFR